MSKQRRVNVGTGICLATLLILAMAGATCWAEPPNPTKAKDRVELQCGTHKVAITCGMARPGNPPDERVCVHNTLSFTDQSGKVFIATQPKKFRQEFVVEKTPTGIYCAQGADKQYYVTVDFVAGPLGCGPCSVLDIFTESGKRLPVNGENSDRIVRMRRIPNSKPAYIEEYGK